MTARLLLLALLVGAPGCIALDGLWFSPGPPRELGCAPGDPNCEPSDVYTFPFNEVPEAYIEVVELESPPVDGEEESVTVYGIWAHQCLGSADNTCVQTNPPERQRRTILYLHGNADSISSYWDRVQILWRLGYNVFALDYRGFGLSGGEPSEEGIYADGRVALAHVMERRWRANPNFDPDRQMPGPAQLDIAYYGFSLGTTVAIQLSVEQSPAALITEAALGGTQAFVDDATGLGLDGSIIMNTRFDNLSKIPFVTSSKLIAHGTDDDFVRFEFSEALYAAASEPKRFFAVEGAGHGNVPCPTRAAGTASELEPCLPSVDYLAEVNSVLDAALGR